jgi:heptosyltransferase-2
MTGSTLVVAPSWVGDAVLSEPLIAALRRASIDRVIDVLAPPWCAPVYARMRGIDSILENPVGHGELRLAERKRIAAELRARSYQLAVILPNSFKSALIPWLARIPVRRGYMGEGRRVLLTDARQRERRLHTPLVERFVALADESVPSPPLDRGDSGATQIASIPAPQLFADERNADSAMQALGLTAERPIAILCPGAEYGPAKRWPAEHFVTLGQRLAAAGHAVWLLGSPNDKAICAPIAAALPGAHDVSGRTDLGTAIDLLSRATIVITNDSGLMHAAAAVRRPLVALFGSSSPRYTPPLSPLARVARIDIECSPCFKRECPLGHFRCMRDLSPDLVYDLAGSAIPPP